MKIVNNASCTNAPACAKNKWMLSHHYKQINIIHNCIVTKLIGNHWYWIIFLQQTPKPVQTPLLQTHFRMMAIRTHRFKLRCNTMKWTDMKTNSKSIPNLWKCKCKMQLTWLHYQLLRKNENWEMEPKKLWIRKQLLWFHEIFPFFFLESLWHITVLKLLELSKAKPKE